MHASLHRPPLPTGTTTSLISCDAEAGFDARPKLLVPLTIWFFAGASRTTHRFSALRHCYGRLANVDDVGRPDRRRGRYGCALMGFNFGWLGYGYVLPTNPPLAVFRPTVTRPGGLLAHGKHSNIDRWHVGSPDALHDRWAETVIDKRNLYTVDIPPSPDLLRQAQQKGWLIVDDEDRESVKVAPTVVPTIEPPFDPLQFAKAEWRGGVRFATVRSSITRKGAWSGESSFTPRQFAHSFLTGGFFHETVDLDDRRAAEQLGTGRVVPARPDRWSWRGPRRPD